MRDIKRRLKMLESKLKMDKKIRILIQDSDKLIDVKTKKIIKREDLKNEDVNIIIPVDLLPDNYLLKKE
jgi:hypothetical protein